MKIFNLLLIAALFLTTSVISQDSDKPGEDFDLEALAGVIDGVSTLEELEKAINDSTNDVNNLDLDKNGEIDFVLIQEEADGNTHVAFLRVAMSEDEFQDIATIEMEKLSSSTASFQIVGDSILYGADYILEPDGGVVDISGNPETSPSGGEGGPSPYFFFSPPAVHVTIVVGCYSPGYVVYVSPYGYAVHPAWYHPWHPVARSSYRARSARWHRSHYRHTAHRRSHHAHNMQKQHRKTAHHHNNSSSPNKATHTSNNKNNQNPNSQPNNTTQQKQSASTQQQPNTTTQQKQGASTQQQPNNTTQQKQGASNQNKKGGSSKRGRR